MYLVWFSLFFLFFFFPSGVLAAGVLVCLVRFIYAWLTVSTVGLFLVFFFLVLVIGGQVSGVDN